MIENIEVLRFLIEGDASGIMNAIGITKKGFDNLSKNVNAAQDNVTKDLGYIVRAASLTQTKFTDLQESVKNLIPTLVKLGHLRVDEYMQEVQKGTEGAVRIHKKYYKLNEQMVSKLMPSVRKAFVDQINEAKKLANEMQNVALQSRKWAADMMAIEKAGGSIQEIERMVSYLERNMASMSAKSVADYKKNIDSKIQEEKRLTSFINQEEKERERLANTKNEAVKQLSGLSREIGKVMDSEVRQNLQQMIVDFIGSLGDATEKEVKQSIGTLKQYISQAVQESKDAAKQIKQETSFENTNVGRQRYTQQTLSQARVAVAKGELDIEDYRQIESLINEFNNEVSAGSIAVEKMDLRFNQLKSSIDSVKNAAKETAANINSTVQAEEHLRSIQIKRSDIRNRVESGKLDIESAERMNSILSETESSISSGVLSTRQMNNSFKEMQGSLSLIEKDAQLFQQRLKGTEELGHAEEKLRKIRELYQEQINSLALQGAEVNILQDRFDALFNSIGSVGVTGLKRLEDSLISQLKTTKQIIANRQTQEKIEDKELKTEIELGTYIRKKTADLHKYREAGTIDSSSFSQAINLVNALNSSIQSGEHDVRALNNQFLNVRKNIEAIEAEGKLEASRIKNIKNLDDVNMKLVQNNRLYHEQVESLERQGAEVSNLRNILNELYSTESRTVDELKQIEQSFFTQLKTSKQILQNENARKAEAEARSKIEQNIALFSSAKKRDVDLKVASGAMTDAQARSVLNIVEQLNSTITTTSMSVGEISDEFVKTKESIADAENAMKIFSARTEQSQKHTSAVMKISGAEIQNQISKIASESTRNKITQEYEALINEVGDLTTDDIKRRFQQIQEMIKAGLIETKNSQMAFKEGQTKTGMIESVALELQKLDLLRQKINSKPLNIMSQNEKNKALAYIQESETALQELENEIKSTTELNNSLINSFNRVGYAVKINTGHIKKIEEVAKEANDQFQTQRKRLYDLQNIGQTLAFTFGFAFLAIANNIRVAIKAFSDFEEKVNKFRGVSFRPDQPAGVFELESQAYEQNVLRIAAGSKFMASEVAEAGIIMSKLGLTTQEVNQSLETVILASEASGESIQVVGEVIAGIKEAFGLEATEVDKIADVLTKAALESAADIKTIGETLKIVGPIAKAVGQDFAKTSAITATLGSNMIMGSQGATTLKNVLLRLIRLTPQAQRVFDSLGVQTIDPVTGSMRDQAQILVDLANKMKYMGSASREAALEIIFGKYAIAGTSAVINEILEDQDAFINRYETFEEQAKGLTKTVKDISFRGLAAELAKLRSEFERMNITMGKLFGETFFPFIKGIREFIAAIADAPPEVQKIILNLTSFTAVLVGTIATAGIGIKTVSGLIQAFKLLAPAVTSLATAMPTLAAMLTPVLGVLGAMAPYLLAAAVAAGILGTIFIKKMGPAWAAEKQAQEEANKTIALQIKARQDLVDILEKERRGHRLNAEELKKEAYAYQLKSSELKKQIDMLDLIDKVISKPGMIIELNADELDAFKKFFPDLIIDENKIGLDKKVKENTIKRIEDIKSNLKGLEKSYDSLAEKTRSLVPGQQEYEDDKKRIEEIRLEIESLQNMMKDAVAEEDKLFFENEINKRLKERAVLVEKVKEKQTQEEFNEELRESQEIEENLLAVIEREKANNKSIIDLLKEQNDLKKESLDLAIQEAELQNEINYARQIGAKTVEVNKGNVEQYMAELAEKQGKTIKELEDQFDKVIEARDKRTKARKQQVKEGKVEINRQNAENLGIDTTGTGEASFEIPTAEVNVVFGDDFTEVIESNVGMMMQQIDEGFVNQGLDSFYIEPIIKNMTKAQKSAWEKEREFREKLHELDIKNNKKSVEEARKESQKPKATPRTPQNNVGYPSKPTSSAIQRSAAQQGSLGLTGSASDEAAKRQKEYNGMLIEAAGIQAKIQQSIENRNKHEKDYLKYEKVKNEELATESALKAYEEQKNIEKLTIELQKAHSKRAEFEKKYLKDIAKFRSEQNQKRLETDIELAKLTLDNFEDDIATKRVLTEAQLKAELKAEKEAIDAMIDNEDEANALKAAAQKRYDDKKRINDAALAQEAYNLNRRYAESLFSLQQRLDEMRIKNLTSDYERSIQTISLQYEASRFELLGKISDPQTTAKQRELYQKQLSMMKVQFNKDVAKAELDATKQQLDAQRQLFDLSIQRNQAAKDMLEIQELLANQTGVTSNMRQYVEDWQKVNGEIKKLSFKEFKREFDKNVTGQVMLLEDEIANLQDQAFNILGDDALNVDVRDLESLKQVAGTNAQIRDIVAQIIEKQRQQNALLEEERLIGDKNFQRYVEMKEMLDQIDSKYGQISSSINEIANLSGDFANGALADMLKGVDSLIGSFISLGKKGNEFIKDFQKKFQENISKEVGKGIGGLMSGGNLEKAFSGIGAKAGLAAAAGMVPAIIAMLPEIIQALQQAWDVMIQVFFPDLDEKYQSWKRSYQQKVLDMQRETDKLLLERGDISRSLFNERELERVAREYKIKALENAAEIRKATEEATMNLAFAKGVEKGLAGTNIFSLLWNTVTDPIDESAAESKYKEQMDLINETRKQQEELWEEQRKKALREAMAAQATDPQLALIKQAKEAAETEILIAQNTGNKKDQLRAKFNQNQLNAEEEYWNAYKEAIETGSEEAWKIFQEKTNQYYQKTIANEKEFNREMRQLRIDDMKNAADLNNRRLDLIEGVSDASKEQAKIQSDLSIRLAELNSQLVDADAQEAARIQEEIAITIQEAHKNMQQSIETSIQLLRDFKRELEQSFASLTITDADDALVAFNSELDAIDDKIESLRKTGMYSEEDLKKLQKNLSIKAVRDYNQRILDEHNQVAREIGQTTITELENVGDAAGAAREQARMEAQELVNNLKFYADFYGENTDIYEQKERETQANIYKIAKEYYEKTTNLYRQDLEDYVEIQRLKAENAGDILGVGAAEAQGQIWGLMLQKEILKKTVVDPKKLKKQIELVDAQIENAKLKGVQSVGDSAIEQLEQIRDLREEIYESEIAVYQADIERNDREIQRLQRDINDLQRQKNEIEREIRSKIAEFDVADKQQFQDALAGMNLDQELRDALEYISNPIENSSFEAAAEVAIEAATAKLDLLKEEATAAYNLEEINAEEYYRRLIQLELQRALVAKYALGEIKGQQEDELQRLRDQGKTTEEIMIYEKRLLEERQNANKVYYESYQNFQDYNQKLIEAGFQDELDVIDRSIEAKEDEVQEKEDANQALEDQISEFSDKAQDDYKDIVDVIKDIEQSTRNWGYTTEQVKNDLSGVLEDLKTNFFDAADEIKNNKLTLPIELPKGLEEALTFLQSLLSNWKSMSFEELTAGREDEQLTLKKQAEANIKNYMPRGEEQFFYIEKGIGGEDIITKGGGEYIGFNATSDAKKSFGRPPSISNAEKEMYPREFAQFVVQSNNDRWYRTDDEMRADEILGFKHGGMYTGSAVGDHSDRIWAKMRKNELAAPVRDFRSFARDIADDAVRGKFGSYGASSSSNSQTNYFTFGNVYGVDELESTISRAIQKSNKDFGYSNSVYLSRNN